MVSATFHAPHNPVFLEPRRVVTLRAARRRSRLVRWARRGTLAAMGAIVAAVGGFCAINTLGEDITTARGIEAGAVRMINPRFTGRDAKGSPYVIVADAAIRRPAEPALLLLENPRLSMVDRDQPRFEVTAENGEYDRDKATLDLTGDVRLASGDGYQFKTSQARLFVANGVAEGREPVTGRGPMGVIVADAFELYREERRIVFEGAPVIGRVDQEPRLIAPLRSGDLSGDDAVDAG